MKNFTIGQKISGGFAVLIILTSALGIVSALTMHSVRDDARKMSTQFVPEANIGGALNDAVARTQLAVRSYGFTADEKYLQEARLGLKDFDQNYADARKLSDAFPQLVKLHEHIGEIEPTIKDYKAAIAETEASNRVISESRETLNTAATEFLNNLDKIIQSQNEHLDAEVKEFAGVEPVIERHRKLSLVQNIRRQGNSARVAVYKAQAIRAPATIADGLGNFAQMEKDFTELSSLLKVPTEIEELARAKKAADTYRSEMKDIMDSLLALDEIGKRRAAVGAKLSQLSSEIDSAGMQRTVTSAQASSERLDTSFVMVEIMLGAAVLLGVTVAIFIIRGINKVLRAVTESLGAGSEQIVSAASQVSGSSQSLAEGASEQAASLEETSASIEEMSSMTKRNAQGANEARDITQAARVSADQSASSVAKLTVAMAELKTSSAAVAKIVKSIDEIAFQTNILALNAAVEAARAGEAGAGFAVVAEEVRSLAQRSAQSAKETAEKIDHALAKSEEGARISDEVSTSLTGIIEQVRKLDVLVGEIAQASNEQSRGIEQVNTTVTQIDKITQANAAAAEESASASEELNAQAAELNKLVGNLLELVDGNKATSAASRQPEFKKPAKSAHIERAVIRKPSANSIDRSFAPAGASAGSANDAFFQ